MRQISIIAPLCNRNMHSSAYFCYERVKECVVGFETGVLWKCDEFIGIINPLPGPLLPLGDNLGTKPPFMDTCVCFPQNLMYSWWRHQIEIFAALLAVTGEFPSHRPVTRSLMFSLICAWISGWINNREAGDVGRNRAHHVVTAIFQDPLLAYIRKRIWLFRWDGVWMVPDMQYTFSANNLDFV